MSSRLGTRLRSKFPLRSKCRSAVQSYGRGHFQLETALYVLPSYPALIHGDRFRDQKLSHVATHVATFAHHSTPNDI